MPVPVVTWSQTRLESTAEATRHGQTKEGQQDAAILEESPYLSLIPLEDISGEVDDAAIYALSPECVGIEALFDDQSGTDEPVVDIALDEPWEDVDLFGVEEISTVDGPEFNWRNVPVDFDEGDHGELISEPTADLGLESIHAQVDIWRYAEQKSLEILKKLDRLDEGCHALADLRMLTRMLLEGAVNARRPNLSISVRSRHIQGLLTGGASLEEIAAAHACREVWLENPELHVDLGRSDRGEAWMGTQAARSTLSWGYALSVCHAFRATDKEELQSILFDMYERWICGRRLQRQFPSFRAYLQRRGSWTSKSRPY